MKILDIFNNKKSTDDNMVEEEEMIDKDDTQNYKENCKYVIQYIIPDCGFKNRYTSFYYAKVNKEEYGVINIEEAYKFDTFEEAKSVGLSINNRYRNHKIWVPFRIVNFYLNYNKNNKRIITNE